MPSRPVMAAESRCHMHLRLCAAMTQRHPLIGSSTSSKTRAKRKASMMPTWAAISTFSTYSDQKNQENRWAASDLIERFYRHKLYLWEKQEINVDDKNGYGCWWIQHVWRVTKLRTQEKRYKALNMSEHRWFQVSRASISGWNCQA